MVPVAPPQPVASSMAEATIQAAESAAEPPATLEILVSTPNAAETIFGEDLISEKSLDEVILSYLADDILGDP